MRVTLLGCGNSSGVPEIGCDCSVCTSTDPKNRRTRVSVFVEIDGINLLIDTSPDLYHQALRQNLRRVDAVLYTHDHADHTNGLDDLRTFNKLADKAIPVYSNAETLGTIEKRFPYAFLSAPQIIGSKKIWYRPSLIQNVLADEPTHKFDVLGIPVTAFKQIHGKVATIGYRIGNFAYSTDCNEMPENAFEALKGVEVWIVDCLRYTESYTHSNLSRTLSWIERAKPKQAILTHMAHDFDYNVLLKELPTGVLPGYDGMFIELL